VEVLKIRRPDDLVGIANLGLTLAEAKLLLAGVQREIVAAQARDHAVRRPECPRCGGVCRLKDYRDHAVSMLFGQVTLRLPRFCCAACGGIEAGIAWPAHCRSTPELDRLQAHLCALMTYRTAADVLEQMFPVDAGTHHETLRRHTLKVGEALGDYVATIRPETAASAIVMTLDATFIRTCAEGERHLEVRVGNVETASGGRQAFGAVAKADTGIRAVIRRNLDAVGRTGDTALTGSGARFVGERRAPSQSAFSRSVAALACRGGSSGSARSSRPWSRSSGQVGSGRVGCCRSGPCSGTLPFPRAIAGRSRSPSAKLCAPCPGSCGRASRAGWVSCPQPRSAPRLSVAG